MTPLTLRGEVHTSPDEVIDYLVSAFHHRGFHVYSKLDIQGYTPRNPEPFKCVLLRLLYPRCETPVRLADPARGGLIRCSAVIRETGSNVVRVQLSKTVPMQNRADSELTLLSLEAENELRAMMRDLTEGAFPATAA